LTRLESIKQLEINGLNRDKQEREIINGIHEQKEGRKQRDGL
jgi:hypothetical protein